MRHCIIALVILALALSFCIISSNAIRTACSETLALLQRAQKAVKREDFDTAQPLLRKAEQNWSDHERFFGIVLRHDEADDVMKDFASLKQYAATQDLDEYLATAASLMATIEHISNMALASYHNILSATAEKTPWAFSAMECRLSHA